MYFYQKYPALYFLILILIYFILHFLLQTQIFIETSSNSKKTLWVQFKYDKILKKITKAMVYIGKTQHLKFPFKSIVLKIKQNVLAKLFFLQFPFVVGCLNNNPALKPVIGD